MCWCEDLFAIRLFTYLIDLDHYGQMVEAVGRWPDRSMDLAVAGYPAVSIVTAEQLYHSLEVGSKCEIWWVDQKEWRPAKVTMKWQAQTSYMLHMAYPEHPDVFEEEMDLSDRTVRHRMRLPPLTATSSDVPLYGRPPGPSDKHIYQRVTDTNLKAHPDPGRCDANTSDAVRRFLLERQLLIPVLDVMICDYVKCNHTRVCVLNRSPVIELFQNKFRGVLTDAIVKQRNEKDTIFVEVSDQPGIYGAFHGRFENNAHLDVYDPPKETEVNKLHVYVLSQQPVWMPSIRFPILLAQPARMEEEKGPHPRTRKEKRLVIRLRHRYQQHDISLGDTLIGNKLTLGLVTPQQVATVNSDSLVTTAEVPSWGQLTDEQIRVRNEEPIRRGIENMYPAVPTNHIDAVPEIGDARLVSHQFRGWTTNTNRVGLGMMDGGYQRTQSDTNHSEGKDLVLNIQPRRRGLTQHNELFILACAQWLAHNSQLPHVIACAPWLAHNSQLPRALAYAQCLVQSKDPFA